MKHCKGVITNNFLCKILKVVVDRILSNIFSNSADQPYLDVFLTKFRCCSVTTKNEFFEKVTTT